MIPRLLSAVGGVAVALATLLGLSACGDGLPPSPSASPSPTLSPPSPSPADSPRRIVSLVPAATEMLFAVGAGDRVLARSAWCDWPPEAAALPVAGDALSVSPEHVLALEPDLVVVGSASQERALFRLRGRVRVVRLLPETVADVLNAILRIGELTGREREAAELAGRIDDRIHAERLAGRGRPPVRVLFAVQRDPVVAAGGGSCVGELMKALGAVNVAGDLKQPWPVLSAEALVRRDPEVIVDAVPDGRAGAREWARYGTLTAVKEGRVRAFGRPSLVRPGPRLPELLEALATAIRGEGR